MGRYKDIDTLLKQQIQERMPLHERVSMLYMMYYQFEIGSTPVTDIIELHDRAFKMVTTYHRNQRFNRMDHYRIQRSFRYRRPR